MLTGTTDCYREERAHMYGPPQPCGAAHNGAQPAAVGMRYRMRRCRQQRALVLSGHQLGDSEQSDCAQWLAVWRGRDECKAIASIACVSDACSRAASHPTAPRSDGGRSDAVLPPRQQRAAVLYTQCTASRRNARYDVRAGRECAQSAACAPSRSSATSAAVTARGASGHSAASAALPIRTTSTAITASDEGVPDSRNRGPAGNQEGINR